MDQQGSPRVLGPGTVAWERPADWRFAFLAGRSLLLQVMHPTVAAGVDQHSDYMNDPWKRLVGTLDLYVCRVLYGGPEVAPKAGRLLRAMHKRIKGVDEQGCEYSALDPEAFHWVHATLVDGAVRIWERFGVPMTDSERERFYSEMLIAGELYGISRDDAPGDWAAFERYFDEMVATRLESTTVAHNVLATLGDAPPPDSLPVPSAVWRAAMLPPGRVLRLSTIGTLPAPAREILGVGWSRRDQRELALYAGIARTAFERMPARLRLLPPVYDAVHRGRYPAARTRAEAAAGGAAAQAA